MPNWCDTTYKCVGDPKEIKELHKVLKYIDKRKTSIVKNDFGKWWLGNLVTRLGGNWEKYTCRGEITGYELINGVLAIYQSTAWREQEGVRQIIEETFPSIKVYYLEQETSCGILFTNDPNGQYIPERFFLDTGDDWEYFETIEQAADFVSDIIGNTVTPTVQAISDALDDYIVEQEDNGEESFYAFYPIETVE